MIRNNSDIDFLHEVSSIPEEIRKQRLKKLIRGKIEGQKNFLFAGYVEKVISIDLNSWQREKVLRVLNISPSMLACYKCRMLKELRSKLFSVEKNENEPQYDFAARLSKTGMQREAKKIYLKLLNIYEKELDVKNFKNSHKLSYIYSWLAQYYHNTKNYLRFNFYRKKLSQLNSGINKISRRQRWSIKANTDKVESLKHTFRLTGNEAQKIALMYKQKALEGYLRCNDYDNAINMLFQMAVICKVAGKISDAEKFLKHGLGIVRQQKLYEYKLLFEIQSEEIKFFKDNTRGENYYNKLIRWKNNFTFGKDIALTLQYILFNHLRLTAFLNYDDKLQSAEKEYVSLLFITSKKYEAYIRKIGQEVNWLRWSTQIWKIKGSHYQVTTDENNLSKYSDVLGKYVSLSKKVYNINRLTLMYNYQTEIEIYRGAKCNFAAANLFLSKLHRIFKTRGLFIPRTWYRLNKVLVNMFEESFYTDKEKVYDKYSLEIKEIIEWLKSKEYTFNVIGDYSKLNFAANFLNIKSFLKVIHSFEDWLKENRPSLFEYMVPANSALLKSA